MFFYNILQLLTYFIPGLDFLTTENILIRNSEMIFGTVNFFIHLIYILVIKEISLIEINKE
jgi:hypothetical protein